MKYLLESKNFYKKDDKILIQYWYNGMLTPCLIKERIGNKFLISHNVEGSKIRNAPDEKISTKDIVSKYNKKS